MPRRESCCHYDFLTTRYHCQTSPLPHHVNRANGGVFTQARIAGLAGNADFNGDGIIEFAELAIYVRQQVGDKAAFNRNSTRIL